MILNVGAGEMIKAALMMQIYAVAVCKNNTHKTMVMETLMSS